MDNYTRQLLKLAAEGGKSQFNENTPNSAQAQGEQAVDAQQAPVPQQEEQAPVPEEQAPAPEEGMSPGVQMAREFLAPVMEAAQQGDENAKDVVARTAGEMAAAANRQAGGAEMAPPASPEEQVADGVVPPEGAQAQVPPAPGSTPSTPAPAPSAVQPVPVQAPMAKTSAQITLEDVAKTVGIINIARYL